VVMPERRACLAEMGESRRAIVIKGGPTDPRQRGKMMKRSLLLGTLLVVLIFWLSGCTGQLGETRAEGSRRHARNVKINTQQLTGDIDKMFLLDKPSKLSERRVP